MGEKRIKRSHIDGLRNMSPTEAVGLLACPLSDVGELVGFDERTNQTTGMNEIISIAKTSCAWRQFEVSINAVTSIGSTTPPREVPSVDKPIANPLLSGNHRAANACAITGPARDIASGISTTYTVITCHSFVASEINRQPAPNAARPEMINFRASILSMRDPATGPAAPTTRLYKVAISMTSLRSTSN